MEARWNNNAACSRCTAAACACRRRHQSSSCWTAMMGRAQYPQTSQVGKRSSQRHAPPGASGSKQQQIWLHISHCRANIPASMYQGAEAGWPAACKPVQQQPRISGPPALCTLRRACEPTVLSLSSFDCQDSHICKQSWCLPVSHGSSDRQLHAVAYCTGAA